MANWCPWKSGEGLLLLLLGKTEVLCGSPPCSAESVAVPGCVGWRQSGVSVAAVLEVERAAATTSSPKVGS